MWRWLVPSILAALISLGGVAVGFGGLRADTATVKDKIIVLENRQNQADIDRATSAQAIKDMSKDVSDIKRDIHELLKRK